LARQESKYDDADATGTNVGTFAFNVDAETLILQPTLNIPLALDELAA